MANIAEDGSVYINTKLNTKGFEAGSRQMVKGIKDLVENLKGVPNATKDAMAKSALAFEKNNEAYIKQEEKVKALREEIEKLNAKEVKGIEFAEAEEEANKLNKQITAIREKMQRFTDTGGKTNSTQFKRWQYDLQNLEREYDELKKRMQAMRDAGTAYGSADTTAQLERLRAEQAKLDQMAQKLGADYTTLGHKIESAGDKQKQKGFSRLASIMGKLKGVTGLCARAHDALHKSMSKVSGNARTGFKNLLKYTFGIATLMSAVRKLKGAIKDGMGVLALYDNEVNASISELVNNLRMLRNSLASAFAPIVNLVAPILNTFIGQITECVNKIAMFFAMLSGKTTYKKAVKGTYDYAKANGSATKATEDLTEAEEEQQEEQEKYLSGLDEITRYTDKQTEAEKKKAEADKGSGNGLDTTQGSFVDEAIDASILALDGASWHKIGKTISDKLSEMMESIDWDSIYDKARDFGTNLADFLNGLINPRLFANLGKTIAGALNTELSGANGFVHQFEWENLGTSLSESINAFFSEDGGFNFELLADTGATLINGILDSISAFFEGVDWYNDFKKIFETAGKTLNGIDGSKVSRAFNAVGNAIIDAIKGAIDGLDNNAWRQVKDKIEQVWGDIDDDVKTLALTFLLAKPTIKIASALISEAIKLALSTEAGMSLVAGALRWTGTVGLYLLATWAGIELGESIGQKFTEWWGEMFDEKPTDYAVAVKPDHVWDILNKKKFSPWGQEKQNDPSKSAMTGQEDGWDSFVYEIKEAMKSAKQAVDDGWKDIKTSASTSLNEFKTNVSTRFNEVKTNIQTSWSTIKTNVTTSLNGIKTDVNNGWNTIKTSTTTAWNNVKSTISTSLTSAKSTVTSMLNSIKSTITSVGSSIKTAWSNIWSGFQTVVQNALSGVSNLVSNVVNSIKTAINGISSAISTVSNAFSGGSTKTTTSVKTVPKLATGAVIPPNAPFLATLGDQKSGNNLELPEDLLRQVVREESGSKGGGTYEFTAQINRKTLFDEVIAEAKLRQSSNGFNPFVLA